jgi:hypothetical protein
MKFYYSGADKLNGEQNSPLKSLGGYISSTPIPNGKVESVFSVLSNSMLNGETDETKVVFLKNDSGEDLKGVLIYSLKPEDSIVNITIGASLANQVELLNSSSDKPYDVDFFDVSVVFAKSLVKVNNSLVLGEKVVIEGVEVLVTNIIPTLFIDSVIKAFRMNQEHSIIRKSDNEFYIEKKLIGEFTNQPILSSFNQSTLVGDNYSGGVDNSCLISNNFISGQEICIWMNRSVDKEKSALKAEDRWLKMYEDFEKSGHTPINNKPQDFTFVIEWL